VETAHDPDNDPDHDRDEEGETADADRPVLACPALGCGLVRGPSPEREGDASPTTGRADADEHQAERGERDRPDDRLDAHAAKVVATSTPRTGGQTVAMERIVDAGDPRLADYRELKDAAARRRIEGDSLFVAEGPVAIERTIASGHRVRSVLVTERKHARLSHLLDPLNAPVYVVDRELLHEIVGFDLHRGAIAAADRRPPTSLADIARTARRVAVLEGLNDPENLGAVARSARALGVDALVLDPTCIDPYTRRTVRVSMGEVLLLPRCRVGDGEWPAALARLEADGFETWALTPDDGAEDVWSLAVPDRLALVLGAEGSGLARRTLDACRRRVRLPIRPDVDSLNVAAAAAVAFAVTCRPRR
jgi:tRNA G18 (ribose-2'-O)-methylase SpoU